MEEGAVVGERQDISFACTKCKRTFNDVYAPLNTEEAQKMEVEFN
jgi:hypothetical protein